MNGADSPLHIVLVEDDRAQAKLLLRSIENTRVPHVVRHFIDPVEAIACIRRQSPFQDATDTDILFLDSKLPKLDGLDVLKTLKCDPNCCTIPVILLSASDSPQDIDEAYRRGANSYIIKPFDFHDCEQMIHDVITYWAHWNCLTTRMAAAAPATRT